MLKAALLKGAMGLAVVAALSFSANTASAHLFGHGGWGSCGSSGGSWGSSGGCCGGSWGSCGGSSGGWHHHHHWSSCGSSGGWDYGSSGGSWGSSGGSWGCCGSSGGAVEYSSPVVAPPVAPPAGGAAPRTAPPTPTPPTPAGPGAYYRGVGGDSGILLVSVPADAKVFVNGKATTSTGADRQYISHGLQFGQSYAYEVRAEYVRDGKPVSETKTTSLTGGSISSLSFVETTAAAPAAAKTVLKLNVPADAKVVLAGHETSSTGATREFTTTTLANGAQWDNYKVVVTSGGETKEQTITLQGGESRELTFDFANQLASAR